MQLVEKHIISNSHPFYEECDKLCFASKNIYNRSLYLIKQDWTNNQAYTVLNNLYATLKNEECMSQLPSKVAQATLRMVNATYKSFFKSIKSDNVNHKVSGPHFLHKERGRYVASFNNQTLSKKVYDKSHKVKLSGTNIEVYTKIESFDSLNCVRIVPQRGQFTIEIIYTVEEPKLKRLNDNIAAIDLGVNNLAAVTFSIKGACPLIINGKPLKSLNQYYNKRRAKQKSTLELVNKKKSSKNLIKLDNKRNNKVNDYLHKSSRLIVNKLVEQGSTKLIIGKNTSWKNECSIGKVNNQNFVQIPHSRFISMLTYKCEMVGIRVVTIEESYTSKCSFLDNESIEKHEQYRGKRIKRGLFRTHDGLLINADINGSYNIMKKESPKVFTNGVEGVVVHPILINVNIK